MTVEERARRIVYDMAMSWVSYPVYEMIVAAQNDETGQMLRRFIAAVEKGIKADRAFIAKAGEAS